MCQKYSEMFTIQLMSLYAMLGVRVSVNLNKMLNQSITQNYLFSRSTIGFV